MEDETVAGDEDESQPVPVGMRYEHGKVVPHLTVDGAGGAGQGGATGGAAVEPCRVHAGRATGRTRWRCWNSRP